MDLEKINLLVKCEVAIAISVLHKIIDNICKRQQPSYHKYGKSWNLEQWWAMTEEWTKFCRHCIKHSYGKDEISKRLDGLPTELQQEATDAIYARRDEIRNSIITATSNMSSSYLNDFDWQLKLVMSSDKLADIKEPLVNLDMDIVCNEENKKVSVELNKDDLKKLIASLEMAQKAVTQMKT